MLYDLEKSLETLYEELRKFLPCDATPFQACLANDGRHVVAVFPNETLPLNVMRTIAQRDAAADAPSTWCSIDAMHETATAPYFAMATARVQAASEPSDTQAPESGCGTGHDLWSETEPRTHGSKARRRRACDSYGQSS